MTVRRSTLVLLLLTVVSDAHAMRRAWPMGHYIREAELIVIADTHKGNNRAKVALSIREVLKGDANLNGQTIAFPNVGRSAGESLPSEAKNIAVMLQRGWEKAENWPVLAAYSKADEIEVVRILAPICQLEDERSRLVALRDTLTNGNAFCRKELFAQLRDMRVPGNYDLTISLYSDLEPVDQVSLVELIGDIGDPRGLPVLITATASPDERLGRIAVDKLSSKFPGLPGVGEAMRAALMRPHLRRAAAQYLSRYSLDPKLAALAEGSGTAWLRASRLLEAGQKVEGRAAYLSIVTSEDERFWTRLNSASLLIPAATQSEKEQIRKALVPLLAAESFAESYLEATDVAQNLRALHHPDCLAALLSILRQTSSGHTKATWLAAMAIRELGDEARQKAIMQIIEQLKSPPPPLITGGNPMRYPLELIWLGHEEDFEKAERSMHADYAASWKSLRPLQTLTSAHDEVGYLVQHLSKPSSSPPESSEWMMFRLGDLKDPRAVPELLNCFVKEPAWTLTRGAAEALVAIGGNEVETELTKLLTNEDESRVRRHATEAIFKLLGDRTRDLALRMLTENGFGWKPEAYTELGKVGTPEDLKLLLSLSDYWTGDRPNHYWAMNALEAVRTRCNYDANGPIRISR